MRILLDLDCVLADFVGGVARLWGLTAADLLRHWPAGEYGMNGPLAAALERPGYGRPVIDDAAFWRAIHAAPETSGRPPTVLRLYMEIRR